MQQTTEVGARVRREAIIAAATDVFLRYGYSRTTMAELAAAAGLSRPTLYETFPGKDDLFAAVIYNLSEQTLERYRVMLRKPGTLGKKLHLFCGDWATHGLKLIERHPDAKDLFDLKFPAVRQMYEDFINFLVDALSEVEHPAKIPTEKIMRNLVFSLLGLKQAATDVRHMEDLVKLQVNIFLATLALSERKTASPLRS